MTKIFRVNRGSVNHIVHETRTGSSRFHNVYVLCKAEPQSGAMTDRAPTCRTCLLRDNPFELNANERSVLTRVIKEPGNWGNATTTLHDKDLVNERGELTPRGRVLVLDWTEGTAPVADLVGVFHTRLPLSRESRCRQQVRLPYLEDMTVEQYARMRKLELHVTCVACAMLPRT